MARTSKVDRTICNVPGCGKPRWKHYAKCEVHQRAYWVEKQREGRPQKGEGTRHRASSDETFRMVMFHGDVVEKLVQQLRQKLKSAPIAVPLSGMSDVYKLVLQTLAADIRNGSIKNVDWPLLGAKYRDLRAAANELVHIQFDEQTIQAIVTIGEYFSRLPGIDVHSPQSYLPQVKIHHGANKEWWNKRLILSLSLFYTIEKL